MSHSSERFPSNDTHQWSLDEDYADGRMSLMRISSDKSQQHQPLQVLSENHPQQQQTPVVVTSSQGYPWRDDSSLNNPSFCSPQQSEQEYSLIKATSPQGVSLKDEKCYQPQQFLPSIGASSPLEDPEHLSSYQPQQSQTSAKVPPQRHPSEDVQPTSYQSFHSPQKQQPSDGSIYLSNHSPTPMAEHSNTSWAQSSSVKAPYAQDPENIPMPNAETFPKNVPIPKSEMPPENVDSTETLYKNVAKNVTVRRTSRSPPPPSCCSSCCIS